MIFGSVCSGIDAASVAWTSQHGGPMDWTCEFFSEIEKFPSAVLAHHYGSNMPGEEYSKNAIPNYGDMTKFKEWPDHGRNSDRPIDVLCGGTPCQSYSIAGLRKGLADPRGSLTLTYGSILARYRPKYFVWENVPGVLSSDGGRDFAAFLGLVTGTVVTPPADGWKNSGIVAGINSAYGIAYRVLDAQFVRVDGMGRAVPQRRRRVFVVGYLGDWRVAAAILFERESLRGHTAPSRKSGEGFAADAGKSTQTGSGDETWPTLTTSSKTYDKANQESSTTLIEYTAPVASTLNAAFGDKQGLEDQHINSGAPLFVIQDGREIEKKQNGLGVSDVAAQPGMKQTSYVAVEQPLTLAIRGRKDGHNLEYRQDGTANTILTPNGGRGGMGVGAIATAFKIRGGCEGGGKGYLGSEEKAFTISTTHDQNIFTNYAVRRLIPIECARLQGFPDGFTKIPWRNKPADNCPDGPQYKAFGNSMAVNVMRWIGQRIELVDAMIEQNSPGPNRKGP